MAISSAYDTELMKNWSSGCLIINVFVS